MDPAAGLVKKPCSSGSAKVPPLLYILPTFFKLTKVEV
jgi:hypothetical protein